MAPPAPCPSCGSKRVRPALKSVEVTLIGVAFLVVFCTGILLWGLADRAIMKFMGSLLQFFGLVGISVCLLYFNNRALCSDCGHHWRAANPSKASKTSQEIAH